MKFILLFSVFLGWQSYADFPNLSSQADAYQDLFNNPSSTTKISKSSYNQGETRPKAVLKGAFYFGGSDTKRELLSSGFRGQLCEDGFSNVFSVYKKVDTTIQCSGNSLPYTHIGEANENPKKGDKVYKLMAEIYDIINSDGEKGPIYLHCHYGVHASNTIAQMVLKQFCGQSDEQAFNNWDVIDLYNSLPKDRVALQFRKIENFQPYPEFEISPAQKSIVCY